MAARRRSNFPIALLALLLAAAMWSVAHCGSEIDRGFDIPIVFHDVPAELVITDQSADAVNIRVLGSRAALRDISPSKMEYVVSVGGAKPGLAVYEVDASSLDLPSGGRIVSRSPASLEVKFEPRGQRSVRVRPDLAGEPAPGFQIASVAVEPERVKLVGARSDVLRLQEVVTETVDVTGISESTEREVRLSLGGGHVWMEESRPVKVRVTVQALPQPEPAPGEATAPGEAAAAAGSEPKAPPAKAAAPGESAGG
jgi:hypothetical protein